MKRTLFTCMLMIASICAFADGETCKISGSTDNSSVTVGNTCVDGTTVKGDLLNDSQLTSATVAVDVVGIYKCPNVSGTKEHTITVRKISRANQSTPFEAQFPPKHPQYEKFIFQNYRIAGISGNKCQ